MARARSADAVILSRKRWHLAAIVIAVIPTLLYLFEWFPAWKMAASAGKSHPVFPLIATAAASLFLAIGLELVGYLSDLKRLVTNLETVSPLFGRVHGLLDARPYAKLLRHHTGLDNLSGTFTVALGQLVKSLRTDGLVVVSASNGDYLEVLESALHHSRTSFEAVLTAPYTPWWFFASEPGLRSCDKLDYLGCVLSARGIDAKARLLVYDWAAPDGGNAGNVPGQDTPPPSFASEFINHIKLVEKYLEAAGQFRKRDGVQHYLFDWAAYNEVEAEHRPQHRKLFQAVDRVLQNRLDFALVDDRLVVQKRTDTGLQVIPLGDEEDLYYRDIFEEFRSSRLDGGAWWIPLSRDYLTACREESRLLSYSEFDEKKEQSKGAMTDEAGRVVEKETSGEATGADSAVGDLDGGGSTGVEDGGEVDQRDHTRQETEN